MCAYCWHPNTRESIYSGKIHTYSTDTCAHYIRLTGHQHRPPVRWQRPIRKLLLDDEDGERELYAAEANVRNKSCTLYLSVGTGALVRNVLKLNYVLYTRLTTQCTVSISIFIGYFLVLLKFI